MACKDCDITWSVAVYRIEEFRYCRIYPRCLLEREEAATDLVCIRTVGLESDCRETTVTCNEGGYTLADKWFKIFLRLFLDCEPVIVRVRIDESR